jgi:hypothetical protein
VKFLEVRESKNRETSAAAGAATQCRPQGLTQLFGTKNRRKGFQDAPKCPKNKPKTIQNQ